MQAATLNLGRDEFLAHPLLESRKTMFTSKKIQHQQIPRTRSSGFKNISPVAHGRRTIQWMCGIELFEKVECNHLVEKVGVVVRRIAYEVSERAIHAIAIDPPIGQEALIVALEQLIWIDSV